MTKWRTAEIHIFRQWDRYFLLDVGRCEAFAIEQVDKRVLDLLIEPKSIEQAEKQLCGECPAGIISSTIDKWKRNGILVPASSITGEAPFQPFTPEYTLTLNVTHACNLGCRYCYVTGKEANGSSLLMSGNTAKKAVDFMFDQFPGMRSLRIGFFGGEPL